MALHILVLNERDTANPLAGGAEVHLFEIFGRLVRRGHKVTLLAASFPGSRAVETIDGIEIHRIANRYLYYAMVAAAARRIVASEPVDIVVDVLCKLPFLSPLVVSKPCVAVVHHLFGTTAFKQAPFPIALVSWLSEKLIPKAYRHSLTIAVSPSTRQDMIERGLLADHVVVVPNGLAHDVYKPDFARRSTTPLVVHVGRLEFYKRVDLLLEAVPLLRAEVPDLRVAIIGEGNALPSLQRLAARLGIEDTVDFLGFVEEAGKVEMLQRAHVLANPSEKEGWGLTVLEGAACGTPTVASNVPGLRDSVFDGKTGLLVPHGDVNALARALSSVLRDSALRERLSIAAIEWAARFQWDASTEDMETLLVNIANGVPPPEVRHFASAYANASR